MLKCDEVARLTSDYIDRQNLTWAARGQFKIHLMMCQNCSRFVHQMQLLTDTLQQREPSAASPPSAQQVQKWLDAVDQAKQD